MRRFVAGDGTQRFGEHECDGDPPALVEVDGTQIPVINRGIRTEMRKDGAMDITRHTEVYFPAEWNDRRYDRQVRALDPNASDVYDPADVYIRDEKTDEYVLVHRGFVMGVGGGTRGNIERRMTIGDVGQLLGAIPFDGSYQARTQFAEIVGDIVDVLEDRITPHIFDSIELQGVSSIGDKTPAERIDDPIPTLSDFAERVGINIPELADTIIAPFTIVDVINWANKTIKGEVDFNAREDHLSDALEEVSERIGEGVFYFEPTGENSMQLVYDENPHMPLFAEHAVDWSGDLRIYRNDALHEITPYNRVTYEGQMTAVGGEATYPYATAVHEPLAQRANLPLGDIEDAGDATTIDEAENKAKKRLKKRLDSSSLGTIVAAPAPHVRPYTVIHSHPACGDEVRDSFDPFRYEVEEVVHAIRARADDGERYHETQMQASVYIDADDIAIESSGERAVDDPPFLGSPPSHGSGMVDTETSGDAPGPQDEPE